MAERKKTRKGHTPVDFDAITLEQYRRWEEDPPAPGVHFVEAKRSIAGGDL